MLILKDSASYNIPFLMVDSGDHLTPKTGLSPTVKISKNCGTFSTPSGTIAEVSLGWYCISGHLQDSNTYGPLLIHASGAGADMYDGIHEVVAFNPRDSVSLGLTNVLSNVASWSGTVLPNVQNPGYVGIDWQNIAGKTATTDFPNTSISGIQVYTGNTKQTGDSFARIGGGGVNLTSIVASSVLGNVGGNLNGNVLGYVNVSGIDIPTASGLANTIITQKAISWQAAASGHCLGEVILQSTNSTITGNVLEIKKTDGTLLDTKALTTVGNAPAIRSVS